MRKATLQAAVLLACSVCCAPLVRAQQAKPVEASTVHGIEGARLADVRNLDGKLYHVQGVDLDGKHVWVTSVDAEARKGYLHQFDRATLKLQRQVEITDGSRFHPGGFSVAGDSIWVPVAEYRPHSSAVLLELDKRTLAVKRRIEVADHIGCVAVTGDGELIAGNWGSRQLYVFDRAGKQLRVIDNPSINQYQDIKFVDGMLVGAGNLTRTSGAVDWYSWPSMKLERSLASGFTDRGRLFTAEAMALKGRDLYLLPEDGPSRLFHFVLPKP
ncbi:MAG: hypothetical protein JSS95_09095 [Acidobacteria bacterium]|nr:hypothetical protein [Acidobacteriota bacterium]